MKLSEMSNLNTCGAQLSDFWPYVLKIEKLTKSQVWVISSDFPLLFDQNLFTVFLLEICLTIIIIYNFDQVTFTTNVMRKKVV